MVKAVYVPKRLVEECERRNIDVVDLIMNAFIKELDPEIVAESRVELAEKYFEEARDHAKKGDATQTSEKLYKVAEECIKALSEKLGLPELEEVKRLGRWTTWLLGSAARTLARKMNEPKIEYTWAIAYDIHVWGFHEGKYDMNKIEMDVQHVEWLLNYTKQMVKKK